MFLGLDVECLLFYFLMDRFFAFRLLLENRIGIWIEGSWRLFLGEVLETVMFFVHVLYCILVLIIIIKQRSFVIGLICTFLICAKLKK